MMSGLMWFDRDPKKSLTQKVVDAATCYRDKTGGVVPDVCIVNPAMLSETEFKVGRVVVKTARYVMPHHFWIGVEEKAHA